MACLLSATLSVALSLAIHGTGNYCCRYKCGRCSLELLSNAYECRCYVEMEGAMLGISTFEVEVDVGITGL